MAKAQRKKFLRLYTEDEADQIALRQIRPGQDATRTANVLREIDTSTFAGHRPAKSPSSATPGTLEKLAIMAARVEQGLLPCNPRDARLGETAVKNVQAWAGDPVANGRDPIWVLRPYDEHADQGKAEGAVKRRASDRYDAVARCWLVRESPEYQERVRLGQPFYNAKFADHPPEPPPKARKKRKVV